MAGLCATLALLLVAAGSSGPAGAPPAGRYDARLCVAVSAQPPSCGPASAVVDPDGDVIVRVDDIGYHLSFGQGALVGITTHGSMQVAEFLSSYRWVGMTLMFGDRPRGLNYEVQLSPVGTAAPNAGTSSPSR